MQGSGNTFVRIYKDKEYPLIERIHNGFKLHYNQRSSAPGIFLTELAARKKYEQYANLTEAAKEKRSKSKTKTDK